MAKVGKDLIIDKIQEFSEEIVPVLIGNKKELVEYITIEIIVFKNVIKCVSMMSIVKFLCTVIVIIRKETVSFIKQVAHGKDMEP